VDVTDFMVVGSVPVVTPGGAMTGGAFTLETVLDSTSMTWPFSDAVGFGGAWGFAGVVEALAFLVFIRTARVQVGARSRNGTPSARKLGRKAMCHPKRLVRTTQTTVSKAMFAGEIHPPLKSGNKPIWTASAVIAMALAMATRLGIGVILLVCLPKGVSWAFIVASTPFPKDIKTKTECK